MHIELELLKQVNVMGMVISDSDIVGGALVFKGTRVPVNCLFDYLFAGDSVKDFLDDFPTVLLEQINSVLQGES